VKLTTSKFQWALGLFFTIPGFFFTTMSVVEFCAKKHPHGLFDAKQFAIIGPLMLVAGISCLFDKRTKA
jgi:hypothetical protein